MVVTRLVALLRRLTAYRPAPAPVRDSGDVIGITTDMDGGIW